MDPEPPAPVSEAEATTAFANRDEDGSGHISKQAMIGALADVGVEIAEDHAVLQGVRDDAHLTCAEFLVFLRICQGSGAGARTSPRSAAHGSHSHTSSPGHKRDKSSRRTSGIRTAMLKLGVVTNNFFTKKLKTPKTQLPGAGADGGTGSGSAASSSAAQHRPGGRGRGNDLGRERERARRRLAASQPLGDGSGTVTVASTAVPSSDVFVEQDPLMSTHARGSGGGGGGAQPYTPTKRGGTAGGQDNNNNNHTSSGYAMSPMVASQSSPFTRASMAARVDYSRRRSSGRIGVRFLATHGGDSKEGEGHGAGGTADSAGGSGAAAGGGAADAASGQDGADAGAGGDAEGGGGVTLRMSNGRVLSMKEIAERLRQFNGPLGGLPRPEEEDGGGSNGEGADGTAGGARSPGIGWKIFGWAGTSNLGRRLHPRPKSMGDPGDAGPRAAAAQWAAAVAAARAVSPTAKAAAAVGGGTDEKVSPAGATGGAPAAGGSPGGGDGEAVPRTFGDLVRSSPKARRSIGITSTDAGTPRSRRQELFASAQKKYKEAVPAAAAAGPGGVGEDAASENGNGAGSADDAYAYGANSMASPVRALAAPRYGVLSVEARALPRTPSMIPRVRSPQRRQSMQ